MSKSSRIQIKQNQAKTTALDILSISGSKSEALAKVELYKSFNKAHWARVARFIRIQTETQPVLFINKDI
jgi:hypothetical protein